MRKAIRWQLSGWHEKEQRQYTIKKNEQKTNEDMFAKKSQERKEGKPTPKRGFLFCFHMSIFTFVLINCAHFIESSGEACASCSF
jgi:hypothetical protein